MDGIIQYTNEDGLRIFNDYLPGTYSYIVLKDSYFLEMGDVEVIYEDVTVEVSLLIDVIFKDEYQFFRIFPNPNNGLINMEIDRIPDHFEIFNAFGEKLLHSAIDQYNVRIDLQGFPKGVYILKLIYGDEVYSKKLIKN